MTTDSPCSTARTQLSVRGLLAFALACLAMLLVASPGAAQPIARARRVEVPPILLFPMGIHLGGTGGSDALKGTNFTIGGELSAVYFDWLRWTWLGGFVSADALLQSSGGKVAFGPEMGFWPFGFDASAVWMKAAGIDGWGMQGRFHLTALVSSLYVGVAAMSKNATVTHQWEPLIEFGILLKFPALRFRRLPRLPWPRERGTQFYMEPEDNRLDGSL